MTVAHRNRSSSLEFKEEKIRSSWLVFGKEDNALCVQLKLVLAILKNNNFQSLGLKYIKQQILCSVFNVRENVYKK